MYEQGIYKHSTCLSLFGQPSSSFTQKWHIFSWCFSLALSAQGIQEPWERERGRETEGKWNERWKNGRKFELCYHTKDRKKVWWLLGLSTTSPSAQKGMEVEDVAKTQLWSHQWDKTSSFLSFPHTKTPPKFQEIYFHNSSNLGIVFVHFDHICSVPTRNSYFQVYFWLVYSRMNVPNFWFYKPIVFNVYWKQ